MDKRLFLPLALFFLCACLFVVFSLNSHDIQNVAWQTEHSKTVSSIMTGLPCIILGSIFLPFIYFFFRGSPSGAIRMPAELNLDEYTGDSFDPNSIMRGHTNGTVIVSTFKQRRFIITVGGDGLGAYQEIDKDGRRVGSPVMADINAFRFGKHPNKMLFDGLRDKVEKKPRR